MGGFCAQVAESARRVPGVPTECNSVNAGLWVCRFGVTIMHRCGVE